MRKWMRDRLKRRNKSGKPNEGAGNEQDQKPSGPAPLQPTFLDRESEWSGPSTPSTASEHAEEQRREHQRRQALEKQQRQAPEKQQREAAPVQQPEYESQPEADPQDHESDTAESPAASEGGDDQQQPRGDRGGRSRRRGRGGRGRNRGGRDREPRQANPSVVIQPGVGTGEAGEVDVPAEPAAGTEPAHAPVPKPQGKKAKTPKGAVVLAIGLPGSGKSSWFRRHNIIPLSSDLVRGLLFDDATEQRFQDLVFSTLRYMLRMRMVAGRPTNYIDATNLSPKERHSWIKMARDFNYEAHAVFFDVPTEICMERNRKRSRNVPDEIMLRMAQKLRPPKFDEGFSKITIVRLKKAEPGSRQDHEGLEPEE